ncbi:Glucose-repressible protein [Cyphellophora attinorum]|uniref:Glucose-repressible protein n=1 Tax=Cyphellophora attinorum TaxID=1664694 RepID=A0A0N1H278_9EURO|nr:Glucose-repressible protein [Phialophora attinorum]KPI38484.1 Glucose-repressible protein [Phialophora attinorum]
MNTLRNGKNWVSSKTQGHSAQVQKETNKQVAKDSHAPIGTRIRAAGDAVKHSIDEHSHKRNADVSKHAAKHNV